MSLKVWLPLNGNLENKGTSNVTVTNNGATVDSAGKIGSCYAFNGSTGYISLIGSQLFQIFIGGTQQFSIAMWVYHADTTRAILFGDYSTSGSINFNVELNTSHGIRFYWAGSPDTSPSNANVGASTWTHVVLTYNGTKIQSYINGKAKGSWSGTLGTKNKTSGEFRLGRDNRSDSTAFNGKMNDFRVYDHCLSAAEVREISQGLVLHYKLDGFFGGAGENLVINGDARNGLTGWGNWGTASSRQVITVNNKKWFTFKTDANGNYGGFSQDRGIALYKPNTQYTISALMYASANASGRLWVHTRSTEGGVNLAQYLTTVNVTTSPALYTFTFNTGTNASYTINKLNLMVGAINTSSALDFYISDIKVEEGLKATAWVPCKEESGYDITKIEDSSGYNHNGSCVNTTITQSEARYSNCISCLGATVDGSSNTIVGAQFFYCNMDMPAMSAITISWWGKNTQYGRGGIFETSGSVQTDTTKGSDHTSTAIANWDSTFRIFNGSNNVNFFSNFNKDGNWHHHVITFDGTNAKYYCDNALKQTGALTGTLPAWKSFCMGLGKAGGVWRQIKQYVSDLRIYCTALSAADIKQLYEVSAKIDNKQNLHAFELIENSSEKITKQGQIKCQELNEDNTTKFYKTGIIETNKIIEI